MAFGGRERRTEGFFEIYMLSEERRSPAANGLGIYVALLGVFAHILQLVLRRLQASLTGPRSHKAPIHNG